MQAISRCVGTKTPRASLRQLHLNPIACGSLVGVCGGGDVAVTLPLTGDFAVLVDAYCLQTAGMLGAEHSIHRVALRALHRLGRLRSAERHLLLGGEGGGDRDGGGDAGIRARRTCFPVGPLHEGVAGFRDRSDCGAAGTMVDRLRG